GVQVGQVQGRQEPEGPAQLVRTPRSPAPRRGRLAQRESIGLTSRGSLVRSQHRPLPYSAERTIAASGGSTPPNRRPSRSRSVATSTVPGAAHLTAFDVKLTATRRRSSPAARS